MGCATGVVKYFVFFANLVFALAGLALIVIGVLYKVKYGAATSALPADFGLAPVLSIIIGCIVFVTAFLGCCGAVKESPCMLTTYSIILLTIFIVQVAIGIYAFLKIKDEAGFRDTIHKALREPFSKYHKNAEATETTDVIQRLLECCGFDSRTQMEAQNGSYPLSCCKNTGHSCLSTSDSFNNELCSNAAVRFFDKNSQVVAGVAIGIAVVEIIGAVFGLCLASSIRNHYRRNIYT